VEHSPFVPIADLLRLDPNWTVIDVDCGHNVMADALEALVDLSLSMAWPDQRR
jgi:hypothetical protein